MKKIMTIALGLGLVFGLATATFAQDKSTSTKKTSAKKTSAKKTSSKSTSKM